MVYHSLIERSSYLEQQIATIPKLLSSYPPGKLMCCANGNYPKWYVRQGDQTTYLSRKDRPLAEKLAARRYLQLQLEDFTKEKRSLDSFLSCCSSPSSSERLLADPRYHELLSPYFHFEDAYLEQWQSEEFAGNPYHPEQLIYKTPLGYKVRSKSEFMISLALYQNHIPHRYECPLLLGSHTIYPDFTLLHPQTHELYYLEHFGLMDDPSYAQDASRKLNRYISNNIYPSINLIITSETEAHPLNLDHIEQLLRLYF